MYNLLRLCELLVGRCRNLKSVKLLTGRESSGGGGASNVKQQDEMLSELKQSLLKNNVLLNIEFSDSLHDREIRLDNGWVIKIGRGLDYFRAPEGRFSIGYCDYDLRKCYATTIDIFHSSTVRSTKSK